MRRDKILLFFSLLICEALIFSGAYGKEIDYPKSWPVSGTPVLEKQMLGLAKFYRKPISPRQRPVAWKVGQKDTLWAVDFRYTREDPHYYYRVPATCRAIGKLCYVFVEDSQWPDRVDSVAVTGLVKAFDHSCKADPTKGIYQMDVETFGTPPDVDGDPRIFILILNIRDGWTQEKGGSYYAGYFQSLNEYAPNTPDCPDCKYSNFREMLYVDSYPLNVKSDKAKGVLAHEFQHLIHWGHDPDENGETQWNPWVNEGCSGYAEYVCGYRNPPVEGYFLSNPNNNLTDWTGTLADYEQTFMFIDYLAEHYGGKPTIKQLVAEPANGTAGVNEVLKTKGTDFTSVFADWVIANYLDDGDRYGYQEFDLPTNKIPVTQVTSLPDTLLESKPYVEPWAAKYIKFPPLATLQVEFQTPLNSSFLLQAVEKKAGKLSVIDFSHTNSLSVSDYEALTLVVARTGGVPIFPYQCVFQELPTWVQLADVKDFPEKFLLGQNYPNPFNAATTITFSLPQRTFVNLSIFNSRGQRVRNIVNGLLDPGRWSICWDGRDDQGRELASGVYFCRLQAAGYIQTRQMVLLK